jgi:hypothetical protein
MKIYLSHSSGYDYENELYLPLKSSVVVREHEVFFPHDTENRDTNSKSLIEHGDIILAEVSEPSTGQGIELGWASSANKSILCIYRSGSKLSSSLKFITNQFIEYKNPEDLLSKLHNWLAANK